MVRVSERFDRLATQVARIEQRLNLMSPRRPTLMWILLAAGGIVAAELAGVEFMGYRDIEKIRSLLAYERCTGRA